MKLAKNGDYVGEGSSVILDIISGRVKCIEVSKDGEKESLS